MTKFLFLPNISTSTLVIWASVPLSKNSPVELYCKSDIYEQGSEILVQNPKKNPIAYLLEPTYFCKHITYHIIMKPCDFLYVTLIKYIELKYELVFDFHDIPCYVKQDQNATCLFIENIVKFLNIWWIFWNHTTHHTTNFFQLGCCFIYPTCVASKL